jgi:2-polyprenyl-3-methyl-5-hydroxy-6-metoxy-1,4-benzoquinol methylase
LTTQAVPTGNTYDKYGSTNPIVRRLMARFDRNLSDLFTRAAPASILDVGCGEGVLTERWARALGDKPVQGVDLDDPWLASEWAARARPNLLFRALDVDRGLPFGDGEFDTVAAIEVLEHVPRPGYVIAEMARVAGSHLLVSVPQEPLWRALNIARGAYVTQLGNTPGHLNHWSRRAFVQLLRRHGHVIEARSSLPWTIALVAVR